MAHDPQDNQHDDDNSEPKLIMDDSIAGPGTPLVRVDADEDGQIDEVVYEDAEFGGDQVKKLRTKLKESDQQKQEYLDGWQRSQADIINIKKRLEDEKREFAQYANENLITDLIPTLDSFDMAMKGEAWQSVSENWRKGVEYIYSQLLSTLKNYGVEQIDPMGETFDPQKHHAVAGEGGAVIEVVLKGYSLNGKIIRAAQVKVG